MSFPARRVRRETVMTTLQAILTAAVQTNFTANTQANSNVLSNPSTTEGLFPGLPVFGQVIPVGSIITGLSPLTIDQKATGNALAASLSTGFVTVERRAQFTRDVPAPALLIRCLEEENDYPDDGPFQQLTMKPELCIVTNAGENPAVNPETALNNFLDALQNACAPDAQGGLIRFTMGGVVYWCRLKGKVDKSPGDLGPQGMAYADVEIIVP